MIQSRPMNRLKPIVGPWLFSLPALAGLAGLVLFGHIQAWPAFTIAALILAGNGLWVSRREEQAAGTPAQSMDTVVAATILNALPDPVLLLDGKRRVRPPTRPPTIFSSMNRGAVTSPPPCVIQKP